MKNYYIATSTLNFNNILTTESISPEIFYTNRNFGYKRFTKVEANPFTNSLLAYDKIPLFKIDESDYDDYPLILEIPEDLISASSIRKSILIDDLKVLQIKSTIYLDSKRIKFIFFKEADKKKCSIKAEPSIETKLLPLYITQMQIIDNNYLTFSWNKSIILGLEDVPELDINSQIDYDFKLNKLKGFFYSYFLGIIITLSEKQRTLKDEFQAIAKSIPNYLNDKTKSQFLKTVINNLRDFRLKVDESIGDKNVPVEELIKAIYLEESGISEQHKLIDFLKKTKSGRYSIYDQLAWNFEKNKIDNKISLLLDNLIEYISKNSNSELTYKKLSRIVSYISLLKQKEEVFIDPITGICSINFNAFKITNYSNDLLAERDAALYQIIVNELLVYPINDLQTFLEEKVNLTLAIGGILKDYVDEWEKSNSRTYINNLLDNLENYKPFDAKSLQSEVLQSFALFILKGDDPEKLRESIKQNKITEHRYALGFWGAIFGFSGLPKTLTNILFENKYINYTTLFYDDVRIKIHKFNANEAKDNNFVITKENSVSKNLEELPNTPDHVSIVPKPTSEHANKNKILDSNNNANILSSLIIEYVENNGLCKITDIIQFLKEKLKKNYKVSDIESHINSSLTEYLQLEKINRSIGVKKRDKGLL